MKKLLFLLFFLGACTQYDYLDPEPDYVTTGFAMVGLNEKANSRELRNFMGIDPRYVEWCAAFVGSLLELHGYERTDSLMARSYLYYGEIVSEPKIGDVVIFSRGPRPWGHVGFYIYDQMIDGELHYIVLGGNQSNKISVDAYPVSRLLGIRRPTKL